MTFLPGGLRFGPARPGVGHNGGPALAERFIAPDGEGTGDGMSWDNAASPADFSDLFADAATTTIYLRADLGDVYTSAFNASGDRVANPVTVMGIKSDSTEGYAAFLSDRNAWTRPVDTEQMTDVTGWTPGGNAWELADGVGGLRFRYMDFTRMGAIFNFAGDANAILIRDFLAYNFRRFVEHPSLSNLIGVEIGYGEAVGFSKQAIKCRGGSYDWHIHHVDFDSARQSGDSFAVGVQISETSHDQLIEYSRFANCHDHMNTYWNGDGISSEEDNYNLSIRETLCEGHTDAGFDLKGHLALFENNHAPYNKKAIRLWNRNYAIVGGSLGPNLLRGGSGKPALIGTFQNNGANVTVDVDGTELIEDGHGAMIVHGVGPSNTSTVNIENATYDLNYLTKQEDYSNDSIDANCTVTYDVPPVLPDAPFLNPNPYGAGAISGTQGTAPTGWAVEPSQNGLTRTITVFDDGVDEYVEIRYAGTTSGTTRIDTDFNLPGDTLAAVGDKIEAAIDLEIVNGAGMASLTGVLIRLNEFDGSNVSLGSGTANQTFQTARKVYSYKRTLQYASVTSVRARLEFTYPTATVIDVRFRYRGAGPRLWA